MKMRWSAVGVVGMVVIGGSALTTAQLGESVREVSQVTRRVAPMAETPLRAQAETRGRALLRGVGAARFPFEFRTIDGSSNNLSNPEWGAAGTPFLRAVPAAYGDMGDGSAGDVPARIDGPSPRAVSNAMCAQGENMPNELNISDYLWQWGQFLDHDFTETPLASPAEAFDIPIPSDDILFDPAGLGGQTMQMDRSSYAMVDGVRQQVNLITAFIDGSNVYGSDHERAEALRTMDGTGRLKTSAGNLMPFNTEGLPNADDDFDQTLFLAGDVRANEQTALAAIHTLFVREHNYWADAIARSRPGASGDEIYERARAIVAAQQQAITYNEFLPLLLGEDWIEPYTGYDPSVDPGITNVVAAAAFRVGHTMLSSTIKRADASMRTAPEGDLGLRDAFFKPEQIIDHGITSVMRGLAAQRAQVIDRFIVDDVRNFLFGLPGAGGFDLVALNLQRGRDHGLGSYNDTREAFGLERVDDFKDINPDAEVWSALSDVYGGDVDMVDPWIGMMAEPHVEGALVGETLHAVLSDQFRRLRDGDRFWYQAYLPGWKARMIDRQTLGVIVRRNTRAGRELPRDVFRVVDPIDADWNGDGSVTTDDLYAFIADWQSGDADVNGDGVTDFDDAIDFLGAWGDQV